MSLSAQKGLCPFAARLTLPRREAGARNHRPLPKEGNVGCGPVKDYSTKASAFLLDTPTSDKKETRQEREKNDSKTNIIAKKTLATSCVDNY